MALLSSSPSPAIPPRLSFSRRNCLPPPHCRHSYNPISSSSYRFPRLRPTAAAASSEVCSPHSLDKSTLSISVADSDDELWAAARLRVRSFYKLNSSSFGIEDHKKYLAEREYEAMKERIDGLRPMFRRVSCLNATLPLSQFTEFFEDFCDECKYTDNGEDRVVVGTLDLNQCLRLPDEITGKRPEGIGADFARAYLSNVCVAKELHRNGLGRELISKSKIVAREWGISDMYVHVAVDNEPAKNLYMKSGFTYENDEPAWQARFLDRPRRLLLWFGLSDLQDWLV
ncbi:unnamed protein product [Linum tenue]|uniref:N-acetyltransferase domain-containing protein n=1 Tax=Linum tenue TaxID=586396 RepID=A0AAV0IBT7_9ROSI|nr:unnamed protein product [Linum tenue]